MSCTATILLPTTRGRASVLPFALESIRAQTVDDLEVFVMGDGVDDRTRDVIHDFMERDPRIRFFDHPKHERRGEPNRHAALAEARGRIVCYLCDRDLMLPHHVETMARLLEDADFAHTLPVSANTDRRTFHVQKEIDLQRDADRQWILTRWHNANGLPLSFVGHTLAMYRRLPHGWRVTPDGYFTDIYMWEQFLVEPACRATSGTRPTILYFPKWMRSDWSMEQRRDELAHWAERLGRPDWYPQLLEDILRDVYRDRLDRARAIRRWKRLGRMLVPGEALRRAIVRMLRTRR